MKEVLKQFKKNSDITTAKYLNFLIQNNNPQMMEKELIDLFIFENQISVNNFLQVIKNESEKITEWYEKKQEDLIGLASEDLAHIKITNKYLDPIFESKNISKELGESEYYYSGMFSPYGFETMIFSKIAEKMDLEGLKIFLLENEIQRDLYHSFSLDACRKPGEIYIRKDAIKYNLVHLLNNQFDSNLFSNQYLGVLKDIKNNNLSNPKDLLKITDSKTFQVLYHEIGHEIVDKTGILPSRVLRNFQRNAQKQESIALYQSINEILANTVRYKDKVGCLASIIDQKDAIAFSFFMLEHIPTNFSSLDSKIQTNFFSDMKPVYDAFMGDSDWDKIEHYRKEKFNEINTVKDKIF
ncbi:hypothetical protein ISS04_04215 [Candidatus Woesearchaeota archaeon]|nr:hypothetical protein [Candidatus Woesearchaeota archaeon]